MLISSIFLPYLPASMQKAFGRVTSSPLAYRLAHGAFWSLLGAVIVRLLGLMSFVIVARVLGKAGYGQFGIIQSTIGMFGVFAGFGLGSTATKYVAELREKNPERAARIMGMTGTTAIVTGIVMASALFSFAPWLASNTLADPSLAPLLRISALTLIFEAQNGAQIGALSGFEAFRTTAKINMWVGLSSFPTMGLGVYLGGLEGAVWGLAVNRAFNWLLNHIALRREAGRANIPFALRGFRQEMPVLLNYSLPAMLSGIMVSPTLWICNALLVNQPGGYEQMGIFQASSSLQQIIFFLGNSLSAPLLPMLAKMIGQENAQLSRLNIISTWVLGAIPAVILIGLPEIALLIYGKEFESRQFINTFLLSIFCSSVIVYKQGLARVLSAYGLMWWGTLSNLFWAVTMVGFTSLFIGAGAFGYAKAWVCAYVLNTILFVPLYLKKGLVPKGTIVSIEALLIWSLLLIGIILNFMNFSVVWRLIYIPIAIIGMIWLFYRIFSNKKILLSKDEGKGDA